MDDAIRATFSDFKLIKGRKVAQLVFEVPIEQADAALARLGGVPRSDAEQWVGVAPITAEAAQKPAEKPKGGKLAQRAGILCGEESFRQFIHKQYLLPSMTTDGLAENLRNLCEVTSRADLDHDEKAGRIFRSIESEYREWMRL